MSRQHPVQEDMTIQQRVWRFERLGWYVLVFIVLLWPARRTMQFGKTCSARCHYDHGLIEGLKEHLQREAPGQQHQRARLSTMV